MRLHYLVFVILLISGRVSAQSETTMSQQTTSPAQAEYEIVQSSIAAKLTFKLNRFTGQVRQLVKTDKDESVWELMKIDPRPGYAVKSSSPRFQIFTSGIAARFTFLLDNASGLTWQLATTTSKAADGKDIEQLYWQMMSDS